MSRGEDDGGYREGQLIKSERAVARDWEREPRAPFVRLRRTRGGDELRNRLTETIAEAQPEETEERLDETTEVTP